MNYTRLAPAGTFISEYMRSQSLTETATAYDFWCALWLLSLACGRDIYLDRPHAPVYLNLYCILIAESGTTRKSSAIRSALRVGRQLLEGTRIGILEAYSTPSTLDRYLHQRTEDLGSSQCAIAVSEFAAFMRTGAGMPILLTDLYDCANERTGTGTVHTGRIHQRDLWVNFLSASTPEWLTRVCSPTVMEGGFTSRCMFIVAEEPKARIAWPSTQVEQIDHVRPLQEISKQAQHYGTITLNENAIKLFTTWYKSRTSHNDPFNLSFESREDAHVLRIAALLCINDSRWVVQASHIQTAIRIIADVKSNSQSLFSGTGARSKWLLGIECVRDVLLMHGGSPISRSKLYLRTRQYLDNSEFISVLDSMHESGMIKRYASGHGGAGRPTELIACTELLRARNAIETVMSNH